jgi:DHA2 family multidrug resistance protein
MRARFNTQMDDGHCSSLIPTVIQGAAVSSFFIPLVALSLSGLRPDQIAAASG